MAHRMPQSLVLCPAATSVSVPKPSPSQDNELDKIEKEFDDEGEKIFSLLERIATACDELEVALEADIQSKRNIMKVLDDIADKKESLFKKSKTVAGITAGVGIVLGPVLGLIGGAIATQVVDSHSYEMDIQCLTNQADNAVKQDQKNTENVTK